MKANFLSMLFLLLSICVFSQNNEAYFVKLNDEITNTQSDKAKILKIADRELKKFRKSNDSTHYLGNKYALYCYYTDENQKPKQLSLGLELLKYNKRKNHFITALINYNVAMHLENYAPELSKPYINKAIESDLQDKKKSMLPHLYHLKGRLYLKLKKYDSANIYFQKALVNFKPEDVLYKASMYNNFGLVHERQKTYSAGIEEFKKGIKLLENKNTKTQEEKDFLVLMYRNLADSYFKNNNLIEAQKIWEPLYNQYKNNPDKLWNAVRIGRDLYDVYIKKNNTKKINELILFLKQHEINNNDVYMNIFLYEMLYDHEYRKNNIVNMKKYGDKLMELKDKEIEEIDQYITDSQNITNNFIFESTNQKFDSVIEEQNKKIYWYSILITLGFITLILIFIILRNQIKIQKEKTKIEEQNRLIIEKDLLLKKEKINNLHLSLNLKQETERTFLEKIKKVRKSNLSKTEGILKELQIELMNLLQIDNNFNLDNENILHNKEFIENLSTKYPDLNEQELILCTYFKLNLNAKEIAIIEKLGVPSVRVYKSKIKAKLALTKEDSLEDFLNTI